MPGTNLQAEEINIQLTGIEPARGGTLYVMLFGKDGYPKKHAKALEIQSMPANKSKMEFFFETDRDHIAIKVHHDEDMNGKVTKNWTGIYPVEGLGFSNKQRVKMTGPPSYRKSKIVRPDYEQIVEISLIYGKKKK